MLSLLEQRLAGRNYRAAISYADIAFYMAQMFGAFLSAPMTGTPALQASVANDRPSRRSRWPFDGGVHRRQGSAASRFPAPLIASTAQTIRLTCSRRRSDFPAASRCQQDIRGR
jgi:hypothetical protein